MNGSGLAITVREATPTDGPILVKFNRALATETEGKTLDAGLLARGVERVLADHTRGLYFVAESDGAVVGQTMVTFEWSDWRCAWFWWLQSAYVHPAHRGRGVFKALYQHILRLCRSHPDTCGLRLYVEKNNRRAVETYLRLGMSPSDYLMLELDWAHRTGIQARNPL
jgi:GNAT superfamily N-acetyltransferase